MEDRFALNQDIHHVCHTRARLENEFAGLDGKFSVEYCAAAALLDGQVGIETFTDQRRFSTDMEETLRKISVEPGDPESSAVRATAQLKDGSTVDSECHAFRGSAANPMSRGERMAKVFDCVQRVLSQQDTERLLSLLENLENVADISEVMEILGQLPRR